MLDWRWTVGACLAVQCGVEKAVGLKEWECRARTTEGGSGWYVAREQSKSVLYLEISRFGMVSLRRSWIRQGSDMASAQQLAG